MNKVFIFLKNHKYLFLVAFVATLLSYLFSVILIHNLHLFLEKGSELQEIFMQLKNAKVITPLIIPYIIYFFISKVIINKRISKNKVTNIVVKSLIGVVTFIVTYLLMVVFSKVNDMGLLDIILSLLENLGGLGL